MLVDIRISRLYLPVGPNGPLSSCPCKGQLKTTTNDCLLLFSYSLAAKQLTVLIFINLTLFQAGSGTYVTRRGGAIMARIDFRPYKCTKLPLGAQNWFPNKYFDLWLSIDTKNSLFITGLPWDFDPRPRSMSKKFSAPIPLKFHVWNP